MPNLGSMLQAGVASLCIAMVATVMYLTSEPAGQGVLLDRPGAPARLVSGGMTATAFFDMVGDEIELTMLFSEPAEDQSVFRSRVRLLDRQRHTIVLGERAEGGAKRFVFRRVGYTVEMRLDPTATLGARMDFSG